MEMPQNAISRRTFTAILGMGAIGLRPNFANAAIKITPNPNPSFFQAPIGTEFSNPKLTTDCFNISPSDFGEMISMVSVALNAEDDFYKILRPRYKVSNTGLWVIDFVAYKTTKTSPSGSQQAGIEIGPVCRVGCFPSKDRGSADTDGYLEEKGVVTAFACMDLESEQSAYYVPYMLFLMAFLFNPDTPSQIQTLDQNAARCAWDIVSACSNEKMEQATNNRDILYASMEMFGVKYSLGFDKASQTYRASVTIPLGDFDWLSKEVEDALMDDEALTAQLSVEDGRFIISPKGLVNSLTYTARLFGRSDIFFSLLQDTGDGKWGIKAYDSKGCIATGFFIGDDNALLTEINPAAQKTFSMLIFTIEDSGVALENEEAAGLLLQLFIAVFNPLLSKRDIDEIIGEITETWVSSDGEKGFSEIRDGVYYAILPHVSEHSLAVGVAAV